MANKKIIIWLIALFPIFTYSQVRINGSSEIRVLDNGAIRVTGDTEVSSGGLLSVNGNFKTTEDLINSGSASNVIIESDESNTGSLIVQGNATGDITIERYLSTSTWHFLSSSVNGVTSGDYYFNGNPDVYASYFDEPTSTWPYLSGTNETMPLGLGYKVWVAESKSPVTAEMKGSIRTSDLNVNLTTAGTGWNLIGNPFTSEINTNVGNWGTNTSGSFYIWDSTYNGSGDYRVWNGAIGDLTDGIIPISQSFFVYAEDAGTFCIPRAAQTHGGDEFYKRNTTNDFVRLQLNVNDFGNTLFIGFPDNGSSNIDYKGDTYKIYSTSESPQLYGIQKNEKLCILSDAPLNGEERTIPVYIDQWINGNYTLSIDDIGASNFDVYLEDKLVNRMIHLSQTKTYQFQGNEGDSKERFLVHFSKKANAIHEDLSGEKAFHVYSVDKTIYIEPLLEMPLGQGTIQIYTINGRKIYETQTNLSGQIRIPMNVSASCYFVHLQFNEFSVVKKVILN